MKSRKKQFSRVSNAALIVLAVLLVTAAIANVTILMSGTIRNTNYPGTLVMLFDYSRYSTGHSARFLGQVLSNSLAYLFALIGVILFIVSLVVIKHDKKVKWKCALIALGLFVPATIGLTGGVINFIGEGMKVLFKLGGRGMAAIAIAMGLTFLFDFVYLVLAFVTLFKGIRTAVKINRGDIVEEPEEEKYGRYEESPEEKAQREEKEAADRVSLLEDIRKIVREELDKLDRVVIAKEVETSKIVTPVKEEVEEEEEDGSFKGISAPRIPFAKKIVKADKDLQDKYNEIKNDILAYGAKSRISIGGDTFRIHRKPYVKITLVGKTLKVYYALNANEFVDSPIPVLDASDKASYVEVPALLKVRSNLSVKRAKELTRLAMEKDGFTQDREVEDHNWLKDIRAELRKK